MSKPDNYKKIKDSFETGFESVSNKELVHRHKAIDNEYQRQDISLEMNRRLIDEISNSINESSRYSEAIIVLTIILSLLAGAQIILLILKG